MMYWLHTCSTVVIGEVHLYSTVSNVCHLSATVCHRQGQRSA